MSFDELVRLMEALRAEGGCPWDREQTRSSLRSFLIEEAYELLEAIEEDDPEKIKEELGDLLFQIVFHAQIARERGEFEIQDVIRTISEKMLSRHPHVFGDPEQGVPAGWEERKRREGKMMDSIFEGIPTALPPLLKALRVQERASRVGFDWERPEDALQTVEEEFTEFRSALAAGDREAMEDELGDLFFTLVNLARLSGVSPDGALRKTINKFITRFSYIEARAKAEGRDLSGYTIEEMDRLWEEAKGG